MGIIHTIAGSNLGGYSGDGDSATLAELYYPIGVAVDGSGNVYISDYYDNHIRMVNTSGIISTFAGGGGIGGAYDGIAPTSAALNYPYGIAVDATGNVYIADEGNNIISKVNSSGLIFTVVGNGYGAGLHYGGFSGDGGPATSSELYYPVGIAVRGGNMYIADLDNNRIRKVNTSGVISTIMGNGTLDCSGDGGPATNAELHQPTDITLDGNGNFYVADLGNDRVRKIDTNGIITTFAGGIVFFSYSGDGGPATLAGLQAPEGVAVDGSGNVYIADLDNNCIRKVNSSGIISTIAGTGTAGFSGDGGPATAAELHDPNKIAIDAAGNIYISDRNNERIRKVNTSGIITTVAGNGTIGFSGDMGPATGAEIYTPWGLATDNRGNLYIADFGNFRIRKVDSNGIISTFAGSGPGSFAGDGGPATAAKITPQGITIDSSGNIYIADLGHDRIRKVNNAGVISTYAGTGIVGFSGDGGEATSAKIQGLWGLTVDATGNIYIADCNNNRIRKLSGITGNTTLCAGSTNTLAVLGASGSWSSSDTAIAATGASTGIITGISPGTATITFTFGPNFLTAVVTVNPLPHAGIITGIHHVCLDSVETLADTATGGIWSCSGGIDTISSYGIFYGSAAGWDTVHYTVANAWCSSSTIFPILVDSCIPTNTVIAKPAIPGIKLYPNPTTGIFTINLTTNTIETVQFTITNIEGQQVMEFSGSTNKEIEVNKVLQSGMYFISTYAPSGKFVAKMAVVK